MSVLHRLLLAALASVACCLLPSFALSQGPAAEPTPAEQPAAKSKITPSKETTYLTEPLTARGYVNYVEALNQHYSRGVKPETNAALPLWQLTHEPASDEYKEGYYRLLGVPMPERDDPEFKHFNKLDPDQPPSAQEIETFYDQQGIALARPWKADEFPQVAAWLQANEAALAKAVKASQLPHFYSPLVADEDDMLVAIVLPGIQGTREIGRALAARAMLRLEQGKYDEAWSELLALSRLGRLVGSGPTLIEGLVGISLEGLAVTGIKQYLQHAPLSREQALAHAAELAKLPPAVRMAEKLNRAERYMSLDATAHIANGDAAEFLGLTEFNPLLKSFQSKADWNVTLRFINDYYDRYLAILQIENFKQQQAKREQFSVDLKTLAGQVGNPLKLLERVGKAENYSKVVGQITGEVLVSLLFPAVEAVIGAETRAYQEWDLLQLGFKLAAYRAEHRKYPNELKELDTNNPQHLPLDRFTGKPLKYQPAQGGYTLYSFGLNTEDNQGRTAAERNEAGDAQADDLTLRIKAK